MLRIKLEDERNVYNLLGKRIRRIGEKKEYLIKKIEIKHTKTRDNKIKIYDNEKNEVLKCFSSEIYGKLLNFEIVG